MIFFFQCGVVEFMENGSDVPKSNHEGMSDRVTLTFVVLFN